MLGQSMTVVLVRVLLCSVFGVLNGVKFVAVSQMGVLARLLVMASF